MRRKSVMILWRLACIIVAYWIGLVYISLDSVICCIYRFLLEIF